MMLTTLGSIIITLIVNMVTTINLAINIYGGLQIDGAIYRAIYNIAVRYVPYNNGRVIVARDQSI